MIERLKENTYIKNLMLYASPMPGFLSGSSLKLIAVITMAIDHFAACIMYAMLAWHVLPFNISFARLYEIYEIMRGIGRQAFPIYCFLLVEGFMHTRSRLKYLGNLTIFALISEIPFDIALECPPEYMDIPDVFILISECREQFMSHQNVFFTLAIGMLCCWAADAFIKRFADGWFMTLICVLFAAGIGFAGFKLADVCNTDYHGIGVLLIYAMYALHWFRIPALGLGFAILTRLNAELWSFPAFILMLFYNGKRGFLKKGTASKYFFYLFYPVHFILLAIIRILMLS